MKKFTFVIAFCLGTILTQASPNYDTTKPWTWWWIFGNATTKSDITAQLEYMQKSGIGGVCIIPVYGEKRDEANYIDLLSPKFMQMLEYISDEAKRLGMGVDMTMGSGWPFGGPWITKELTAKKLDKNLSIAPANFKVKRSSPGGHGLTADPFNPEAYKLHCTQFEKPFAPYKDKKIIRAFFNDSYEYNMANVTDNFFDEFKKRRGYDMSKYAKAIFKPKTLAQEDLLDSDTTSRIWQDYHLTLSELLYETISEFTKSAHEMGMQSVNQAHGSAGNILDLYALADIPETESFGASNFNIDGVKQDPDYEENRFGRPNKLMMKFASSVSSFYGKKLTASESCTWLANHFKVSLAQVKPELDKLFASGINHIFYHGMPYSPIDKPFPGRLFYASTNFNFNSHFKETFCELNKYVKNIQSILQNSNSDNDILLYFPIHAFWRESGGENFVQLFDVHKASKWLERAPKFDKLIHELDKQGYCFDFASDKMLSELHVENGLIASVGKTYKVIVIADTQQLPIETFRTLENLAKNGANIIFQTQIPSNSTGFANLEKNQKNAKSIAKSIAKMPTVYKGGIEKGLKKIGIKSEILPYHNLEFIRKTTSDSTIYFIANQESDFECKSIEIPVKAKQIEYFNPLTGERAILASKNDDDKTTFQLQMRSGESVFIFANKEAKKSLPAKIWTRDAQEYPIKTDWTIEFVRALPSSVEQDKMPATIKTKVLKSLTELGDDNAKSFCGVAKYSATFKLENPNDKYDLSLQNVRDSARVKINGAYIGNAWCAPFRLNIPNGVLKNTNLIEIEVTNNSFNRARALSRENQNWLAGNFFVDITYKKYDIANKPLEPAGLLSEPKLIKQK